MPDNTVPLPLPVPYGFLVQEIVKQSLWSGLVFYLVVIAHPKERLDHWNQLEKLTQTYQVATARIEVRAEMQLNHLQDSCQAMIANDLALSEKNRITIEENRKLSEGNRDRLEEIKQLLGRSRERTP